MDSIDSAKKQYWIFSAVIAFIISILVTFTLFSAFKGSIIYGFPLNYGDSEGIANFFLKLLNVLIMGAILTPGVYFFFQWLQSRR